MAARTTRSAPARSIPDRARGQRPDAPRRLQMTLHRVSRFAFTLGLLALPSIAQAQAFGLNEIGTCAVGRAFANTGAPCDDASSVYWNPAALPKARGCPGRRRAAPVRELSHRWETRLWARRLRAVRTHFAVDGQLPGPLRREEGLAANDLLPTERGLRVDGRLVRRRRSGHRALLGGADSGHRPLAAPDVRDGSDVRSARHPEANGVRSGNPRGRCDGIRRPPRRARSSLVGLGRRSAIPL